MTSPAIVREALQTSSDFLLDYFGVRSQDHTYIGGWKHRDAYAAFMSIRAALAALDATPGEGVLVSRDLSDRQIELGMKWLTNWSHMRKTDRENALRNAWTAMLPAAPLSGSVVK